MTSRDQREFGPRTLGGRRPRDVVAAMLFTATAGTATLACGPRLHIVGKAAPSDVDAGGTTPAGPGGLVDAGGREPTSTPIDAARGPEALTIAPSEALRRLTVALWAQPEPDADLLKETTDRPLKTSADIGALAGRMVQDPRAAAGHTAFFRQWLQVPAIEALPARASLPPGATSWEAFRNALARDVEVSAVTYAQSGPTATLRGLLDLRSAYVDAEIASVYGLDPASLPSPATVEVPNGRARGGLLGKAGFMALGAVESHTRPSARGSFVQQVFLGVSIPPPPAPATPPLVPREGQTSRQAQEEAVSAAVCASCHRLIDPIGFTLESLDAFGAVRTLDGKAPIDDSAAVILGSGEPAKVDGPEGLLTEVLTKHLDEVTACFTAKWLSFATGRSFAATDDDVREAVGRASTAGAAPDAIQALITASVQTRAFLAP